MEKIYVTKPYLPPKSEYLKYVDQIFDTGILTNQGPLVKNLEEKLSSFLGVENFHYLTNGTIALQLALRAFDFDEGEIITTPFSYVATTSSILWERYTPVFVDIEPNNFTIDSTKIEASITPNTKAILAVHVFGYACNVDEIQKIADKYNLKVIYDSAHAFAVRYKDRSLASYGDISTLSFHATKLFHTIEGGACIVKDKLVSDKIELMKRFGHHGDEHFILGINAKQDEFNAAMGLANLPHMLEIIEKRRHICELYDDSLLSKMRRPSIQKNLEYNYAYYPIVFETETDLLNAFDRLNKIGVYPRRYFYPSLNKLPYLAMRTSCPISEEVSLKIACLPLYVGLDDKTIMKILSCL